MPTVAEQLRHAREEQKLDVYQVAEITKIKTDHIRALEAGRYEAFTAPVYIRGFVRTYAKALKLEVPRLITDLDAELSQIDQFREPPSLTGQKPTTLDFVMLQLSRLNWRSVVIGAAIVLLFWLAASWWRGKQTPSADPLKQLGSGQYQPRSSQAGEVLPLPVTPTNKP